MDKLRKETIDLILRIYRMSDSGGALHIVIDDGNTEDRHITWCLQNSIKAIEDESERELYTRCAVNLLKLGTERKRDNAISDAWKLYCAERRDS